MNTIRNDPGLLGRRAGSPPRLHQKLGIHRVTSDTFGKRRDPKMKTNLPRLFLKGKEPNRKRNDI